MHSGLEISCGHNFNIRTDIPSDSWALFGSRFLIISAICDGKHLKVENLKSVKKSMFSGKELSVFNNVHCSEKKLLNKSAFSPKSVI